MTKLVDLVVGCITCFLSFFTFHSDAYISLLDHCHIVTTISYTCNNFTRDFLYKFCDFGFLFWLTPAHDNRLRLNSNSEKFSGQARFTYDNLQHFSVYEKQIVHLVFVNVFMDSLPYLLYLPFLFYHFFLDYLEEFPFVFLQTSRDSNTLRRFHLIPGQHPYLESSLS